MARRVVCCLGSGIPAPSWRGNALVRAAAHPRAPPFCPSGRRGSARLNPQAHPAPEPVVVGGGRARARGSAGRAPARAAGSRAPSPLPRRGARRVWPFARAAPPGARPLSPAVHRAARAAWRREPLRSFVPFFASRADFGRCSAPIDARAFRAERARRGEPLPCGCLCPSTVFPFFGFPRALLLSHRPSPVACACRGLLPHPLPSPAPAGGGGGARPRPSAPAGTEAARSEPSLRPQRLIVRPLSRSSKWRCQP